MEHLFSGNNWSFVHRRLQTRLVLFLIIALALIAFAIYEIVIGDVSWTIGLISFVIGGVLGFIYGRLIRVKWDESEQKIVRQMDVVGIVIIIVYVILSSLREWFLGHFFSGVELTAIGVAVGAGILIGRFLGMHRTLMRTIRENRKA